MGARLLSDLKNDARENSQEDLLFLLLGADHSKSPSIILQGRLRLHRISHGRRFLHRS